MAGEIGKNVRLEAGEEILYWALVQQRTSWLWMQPGVLQLTSGRLILLEHHAFSADWILEIPRFVIVNVTSAGDSATDWTTISYSMGDAVKTLKLRPLALRGRPSLEQCGTLADALRAFHSGELSHDFVANSEKQHAAAPPSYSSVSLLVLLCVVMLVGLGSTLPSFLENGVPWKLTPPLRNAKGNSSPRELRSTRESPTWLSRQALVVRASSVPSGP